MKNKSSRAVQSSQESSDDIGSTNQGSYIVKESATADTSNINPRNRTARYWNNKRTGFTLIELLVVIAIIGILSGVVLASLTTARAKGADAAVKEDLHGIRSEAEIFNSNNSTYSGVCGDPGIDNALENASTTGGNPTTCNDSPTAWAASATLKGAGGFWCVDNSGAAVAEGSDIGTGTVCP